MAGIALAEHTYIGSDMIIDQHVMGKQYDKKFIKRVSMIILVDTDKEIELNLETDLLYDREKYAITSVEDYGHPTDVFNRKFSPGITELEFFLTGSYNMFHEINRNKTNGLGIQVKIK